MNKNFVKFPFMRFKKQNVIQWVASKYFDGEVSRQMQVNQAYEACAKCIELGDDAALERIQLKYEFEPHFDLMNEAIKSITLKNPELHLFYNCVELLSEAGIIFELNQNKIIITAGDEVFDVYKFSTVEPKIKNKIKDLEEKTRSGKCHYYSELVALYYLDKNIETEFVTGRIYQLSKIANYLHSWVEIKYGEKTYVIDASKNIVIDKDLYYLINHVEDPERIHAKVLKEDIPLIRKLAGVDYRLAKVYYDNAENGRRLYNELIRMGEIKEESVPGSRN